MLFSFFTEEWHRIYPEALIDAVILAFSLPPQPWRGSCTDFCAFFKAQGPTRLIIIFSWSVQCPWDRVHCEGLVVSCRVQSSELRKHRAVSNFSRLARGSSLYPYLGCAGALERALGMPACLRCFTKWLKENKHLWGGGLPLTWEQTSSSCLFLSGDLRGGQWPCFYIRFSCYNSCHFQLL